MEHSHQGEPKERQSQERPKPRKLTREMLFLAEQATEGKLKVLPAESWGLHYPAPAEVRAEKLQGVLDGKYSAKDIARDIKPDALFYDVRDIEKEGLEKVSARVRDLSAFITHFDHSRFAQFVENMRGREIPIDELEKNYGEIAQARIQKKMLDAYGYTGRKQIENVLRDEAQNAAQEIPGLPRSQKVLKAAKTDWVGEELGLVAPQQRDRIICELSGDERKVFDGLRSPYREYVQRGDENAYKQLVEAIKEDFPKIQKPAQGGQPSESMQELQKELGEFMEQAVPPGTPSDPAIAPEDRDEYHTPPPSSGESKEKTQERPIFEIAPPLGGYYASGRKSYFDIETKTWSKKKQLSSYDIALAGDGRSTISGMLDSGLKSLPLPNGYALDASSLKAGAASVKIKRDQNGCFYLDVSGSGLFSIDFLPEQEPFAGKVISQDLAPIFRGSLSSKSEAVISRLLGSPLQKAEQARQHILASHFYPGGGDLQAAQALQYKLRFESSGDNYLQNIDQSEYLECYSSNTLFIAIMRKAGVPARLVVGHKVEGAKGGKSTITQKTGHAWSEIWDGKAWRRFDATPNPKPEDKKDKEEKDSQKEPAKEAQDGGVDKPSSSAEASAGKQEEGEKDGDQKQSQKTETKESQNSSESGNPMDQMSEASDGQMQESESQMQEAKEQMDQQAAQKQELDEKVQNAEKFKELSDLQKEIEESELYDDFKKELNDKLGAKEDQMKDKIKDELDKMVEDGFMDEKRRDEILKELEQRKLEELDRLQKETERENKLYNEYENIRQEVAPLVDKWFKYFAERLPRQKEVGFDEDSLTRQGAFNRRAVMKPRNLLFGTVKNPREIKPSVKPRFMAAILLDVSGSMEGEKLKNAKKLLVFYSELFGRISDEFGYILSSIDIFSDSLTEIKSYQQNYGTPERYDYDDGTRSTVKFRLMNKLAAKGGTNMLDAIKKAAGKLNEQVQEYPDYASAFYFLGDGGDTRGNAANIKKFLAFNDSERGFGEHMYSAILLGDEAQRRELAEIFGDEHTNVAPDFDELIEKSMEKFEDDLDEYLKTKTQIV